jgi:hypothetical protein
MNQPKLIRRRTITGPWRRQAEIAILRVHPAAPAMRRREENRRFRADFPRTERFRGIFVRFGPENTASPVTHSCAISDRRPK